MNTESQHLLVEYFDCDPVLLQDINLIELLMNKAAIAANANVVASVFHPFSPQGITGVVVIEESHLSVHTWPEYNYASVDFYTCGDCDPLQASAVINVGLKAKRNEKILVERGLSLTGTSMHIRFHDNNRYSDVAHIQNSIVEDLF